MLLQHLHIPGISRYAFASKIQDKFVAAQLAHKANPAASSIPEPVIITAQFEPVYTCGRREIGTVSDEQKEWLTQPTPHGKAEFYEALRGGQTTFHGPGQLVAYPIIDLKYHGLTPRSYVCLLEKSVIEVLSRYHQVTAKTTDNPGVWTDELHKICALGVHLRRNITSHGIGLNVSTNLAWFERIVACGLEGKKTTSIWQTAGSEQAKVEDVAAQYVEVFAEKLHYISSIKKEVIQP